MSVQDAAPIVSIAPAPLVKFVPHHRPIILTLNQRLSSSVKIHKSQVYYDFKNTDDEEMANFLLTIDWDVCLDRNDIQSAAQTFSNIMLYAIDRYVPKKVIRCEKQPWQSNELKRLKIAKKAALKKYTKRRNQSFKTNYVRLNNKYKRVSKRCYLNYQNSIA